MSYIHEKRLTLLQHFHGAQRLSRSQLDMGGRTHESWARSYPVEVPLAIGIHQAGLFAGLLEATHDGVLLNDRDESGPGEACLMMAHEPRRIDACPESRLPRGRLRQTTDTHVGIDRLDKPGFPAGWR